MRRILKLVLMAVCLVAAAAVGLILFLDRGIQRAVEIGGPRLTRVEVRLERVEVSLISGRVELRGLFVGNPEGYESESAIELGSLVIEARPSTIFSDKVVLKTVDLRGPVITFEGGLKRNNLTRILENVSAHVEKSPDPGGRDVADSEESSRKFQVDELVVANGKVRVWMDFLGGRATAIDLPEIRMLDLGTGPEGITTEELTDRLLRVIIEKATLAAASAMAAGSAEGVTEGLKRAGQQALDKALDEAARGVMDLLKGQD